mmetsp:Transcript_8125/g.16402  ORF Transcript_8125/g.16402 Transcript_8125/m.16402 type:complete len:165 (+) Transcript_8125:323-817(+)|eukprot:CAMPEP_0118657970 /NCGR_PEP_ID=MMETSP0785-20121206/14309_1 /TAXON_ID=91992 /ORGANISM="Bolidomonas pacifica, Strain CCMP 1866" /LENGTH=164 /DNA_ID=CAMNT_0006550937 /DNA_START=241 /DNA_END=735 /DNA_ORIENTATION=-
MSTPLHAMISKLPPLKRLGATIVQGQVIPHLLAVSDPYLSSARPLKPSSLPPTDVGCRILFIPDHGSSTAPPSTLQLLNPEGTNNIPPSELMPHVILPEPKINLSDVITELKTSPMWEEVGLCPTRIENMEGGLKQVAEKRVLAAIYLQHTIEKELGGWTNSFG